MTIFFEVSDPGDPTPERDHLLLPTNMDELFRSPEEFLKEVVSTVAGLIRTARENKQRRP